MDNTWDTEDLEELTDAELAEVEGGSTVFNAGYYAPYITQVQEQVAAFNFDSTVVQIASQNA
jgi:bacteriocin-like protein